MSRKGMASQFRSVLLHASGVSALCVVASLAIASLVLPLIGGELDRVALVMSIACPLMIAFPVSFYQAWQRQRLGEANAAIERMHIDLDHAHRALAQAHALLAERVRRDAMTGVLNRDGFFQAIAQTVPPGAGGTLLVIDVDHFKAINDSYGHQTGDEALKLIASTVAGCIRDGDLVGRIGGEEFAVFLTGADEVEAAAMAERIRAAVAGLSLATEGGGEHALSVSIGGAGNLRTVALAELMLRADRHLYEAKRAGRNRVVMGRRRPEAA